MTYMDNEQQIKLNANQANIKHVLVEWTNFFSNFGDYVAPFIISKLNSRYIAVRFDYCANKYGFVNKTKILFTIASILRRLTSNSTIWGSAFLSEKSLPNFAKIKPSTVDCRIVRGPKSEKILLDHKIKCSGKYADPGILLPFLFNIDRNTPIKHKYGFCLNENDMQYMDEIKKLYGDDCIIINMFNDPLTVLLQIAECETIVASALHGLMVSECLNKNCVLLFNQSTIWTNPFKYEDYFMGTSRPADLFKKSISILDLKSNTNFSDYFLEKGKYDFKSLIETFPFEIEDKDILAKITKYYTDLG